MRRLKNVFYYLKKFGNKSFNEHKFNQIDSIVLCLLSYLNLDDFVPHLNDNSESISFISLLDKETIAILCDGTLDEKKNKKLLRALKTATRYEGLYINYLDNRFYVEKVEQFFAVTFVFQEFVYVVFRGTDLTLLGWKEDFYLAFQDTMPAQIDSSEYLLKISKLVKKPLYVGGHSKGGNLAVYSSLHNSEEIQSRIINIFDHDGPGFTMNVFETKEYLSIEPKILKTTCRESLIGILLHHNGKMKFVDARGISILQHDLFNWKITKEGELKYVKNSNLMSKTFEKTCNNFLESTSREDREIFIHLLFYILMEKPTSTITDIYHHPITYFIGIRKRFLSLSLRQRGFILRMLKYYRKLWAFNFKFYLKRAVKNKRIIRKGS